MSKGTATMTEWEANSHFLALFTATGLLKGEIPQSLALIGPPGEGKSALVRRFTHWPGHLHASDITANGIRRALQTQPRLRMFILDELQRLFAHTFDTVQTATGLLISLMSGNASTELVGLEGIDLSDRQVGVLAAIPNDVLNRRLGDMMATGLLSRFAFLSVVRSDKEKARVRRNIYMGDWSDLAPYPLPVKLPTEPVEVTLTDEARRDLEVWGSAVFAGADDRKHVMLTILVRSVALLCGRRKATAQDVRTLKRFEHHLRSLEVRAVASAREIPAFKGVVPWA